MNVCDVCGASYDSKAMHARHLRIAHPHLLREAMVPQDESPGGNADRPSTGIVGGRTFERMPDVQLRIVPRRSAAERREELDRLKAERADLDASIARLEAHVAAEDLGQ